MSEELNLLYDQLRQADKLAQDGDAQAQADAQAIYAEIQRLQSLKTDAQETPTDGTKPMPAGVQYAPQALALTGVVGGASAGPTFSKNVIEPITEKAVKKLPGEGVKNYIAATTELPFAGGKTYETAYQKANIAAGQPIKSRGSNVPMRRGSLGITTQPEPPPFLKGAVQDIASKPASPAGRAGSAVRLGATGSLAGKTIQDIQQGNYGEAGLHGAGALATLAGQSRYKPLRILGNVVAGGEIASGLAPYFTTKKPEEKAAGGLAGYAKGEKVVKGGLEAAKKLFVPKPTKIVRASEALGPHEGKYLNLTQSDRMRSTGGDLGGPGFSKFQLENPDYVGAAWGVGNKPTASGIVNVNKRYPEGKAIWAPMIGAEGQHRSNQHVYDALTDEFNRQVSMGKLTPELREAMNKRLASTPKYGHLGLNEIDVANPEQIKQLGNTFDRRAAISEVIGGEGVGGRKGQIFDYPGVMQEMTDPMTIGAPTHSMGTRLFNLTGEVEHRPDLHSAFPYILKGEDMGVAFNPVPKELAYPSWINMAKEFTGREPGYMELTRGIKGQGKPFQFIDEKYLRALEEAGHAEGGPVGYAAGKKVVEAGLKALEPQQTVKAYKLFRTDPKTPESLYPLFVNANKPVPIGQWLPAEAGELTAKGKVKSKIGDLAYRPGWHAGDMPIATHIGGKSSPELTAPDFRPSNQVWAEVEMPADVDWQKVALERAQRNKAGDIIPRTAHITDTIPEGGHYRYKTNPNMTGDWLIGGSMKVNRVLTPEEVMAINEAKGVADLPRFEPLPKKADGGMISKEDITPEMWDWILKYGRDESLATDDGVSELGLGKRGMNKPKTPTTQTPFLPGQAIPGSQHSLKGSVYDTEDFKRFMLQDKDYLTNLKEGGKTPAWQRKEGKNPEGGLNAAGRASYNRETGGNLKAPQPEGGPRRDSFCARMSGMKKKLTSSETANDPDSRINKALRKWNC